MDDEELKQKGGEELFKELLRRLPTADIQDYYKNGVWQESIMRLDINILEGHRQEAGSPEPIPLEEVEMPELPKANSNVPSVVPGKANSNVPLAVAAGKGMMISSAGKLAPRLVAGRVAPKIAGKAAPLTPAQAAAQAAILKTRGLLRPGVGKLGFNFPKAVPKLGSFAKATGMRIPPPKAMGMTIPVPKQKLPLVKAVLPKTGGRPTLGRLGPLAKSARLGNVIPKPDTAQAASSASRPVPPKEAPPASSGAAVSSDLRAITAFVSRWNLEPAKAKLALAKLNPQKRSYVMANFGNVMTGAGANGGAPITRLEQYIHQCERLNSWNSPQSHNHARPQSAGPQTPGARTIPAPATKPVARNFAGTAMRKFAGVGAKNASLRKPSYPASSSTAASSPARVSSMRTMAPKAAGARRLTPTRMVTPRLAPKLGKGTATTVKPPLTAPTGGKGSKGTTQSAIGQGVKRPVSNPASSSWQGDQKRPRLASSSSQGSSASWSGQSAPHSVGKASAPHSVAKAWNAPFTAAKASVVAPKAKAYGSPGKQSAAASSSASRQNSWSDSSKTSSWNDSSKSSSWTDSSKTSSWTDSSKTWSDSGNSSSWGSSGKSAGKNNTSSASTSWGTGGSKGSWNQGGGKAASSKTQNQKRW